MKFLEKDKVTESFTGCFIDKMLGELAKFNPVNIDAQLWSNILLATIIFNRVKLKLSLLNNTA
ncbi:hypothetical protein [Ferruginibacter sp.]|uniref:hypothetical protein n=1 Tax=Ferruginibacter sp. TaxID=1940288 RepID=UPI0026580924|nr:hypothetical protein [Ferruginibacter sp.]